VELEGRAVELVKEAMAATGVTQSELARRVGVTPSAVSNALAGHSGRGMSLARLERWMLALGWRVRMDSEFVGGGSS
jgi:transcriptional regulator with XRE-family HTH domain